MRVVGVIAEYNPFHKGHAYHLREARKRAQADAVVVVMSSCFTQRGEPALLSPADRARMALQCGADVVFALPAVWAVRDAEHFALGGVSMLAGLGCDAISFGTEATDLTAMQTAAAALEQPEGVLHDSIRKHMTGGLPYPAAMAAALEEHIPGSGELLTAPNSTLGICYLRAMLRLGISMDAVPVLRTSGSYHDTALGGSLPSATALRGAILRGDWTGARGAMPDSAFAVLKEAAHTGRLHRPDALDAALLYRLRTMSPAERTALPDLSEGIEDRLYAAACSTSTREDLLQTAKTRRYPHARLSRLATHALLGFTDDLLWNAGPSAAWLLGFRQESRELLRHIKLQGTLPILSKAADFLPDSQWFRTELTSYSVWALGAGLPGDLGLTQGVVRV